MHSRPCSVFAGRRVASFVRREFEVHDAILGSMIARVCVWLLLLLLFKLCAWINLAGIMGSYLVG